MDTPITHTALVSQLRELGLAGKTPVMVHASLRKIGPLAGGADSLIDTLLEAQGPEGTLLMVLGAEEDTPFDALTSRAEKDIGALAEVFRNRKEVRVNDHVAGRFGAIGPLSEKILEPVPLHDYYGPGSPLERFTALGGWVLRLGADQNTVTLTHWAEYLANVSNKLTARRRYVRADSGEQWIDSLDDSFGIVDWPHGDYFTEMLRDFIREGHVRSGRVGNCDAELFAAGTYVPFAVEWMEKNLIS